MGHLYLKILLARFTNEDDELFKKLAKRSSNNEQQTDLLKAIVDMRRSVNEIGTFTGVFILPDSSCSNLDISIVRLPDVTKWPDWGHKFIQHLSAVLLPLDQPKSIVVIDGTTRDYNDLLQLLKEADPAKIVKIRQAAMFKMAALWGAAGVETGRMQRKMNACTA